MNRDRLIEVIKSACNKEGVAKHCPEKIADALISANYADATLVRHDFSVRLMNEVFLQVLASHTELLPKLAFRLGQLVAELDKE